PSLHCGAGYFKAPRKSYTPSTKKILGYWRTRAARLAASCGRAGGALLNHLKTTDTVADIEDIRVALGQDKLNFYGFSYGTYIAEVYATLHPDRVRRFVLDGVVDPTRGGYDTYGGDQDVAAEGAIDAFYQWVAKHDRAYGLGRHWRAVRAAYRAELRKAATKPWHGRLGPSDITDAMTNAVYYASEWPEVASALSRLHRRGNGADMLDLYRQGDASDDNGYAVYLATSCTDDASFPASFATWVRDARRLDWHHRFLSWSNAWYGMPCRTWPAAKGTPVAVSGAAVTSKILLVNETRDAATPFSGGLATRRLFPTASLVAGVGGTTHAGSLSGVPCVDNTIAQYLADGTVPARAPGDGYDLGCPRVPPPAARAARVMSVHHGMPGNGRFPR
ncbi:MAG: uncharacterized protein JWO46_1723, partial [Nocardioidaceae bacterium]|nr:uncharacterized protein [Nocardioidaceae bacterium]